MPRNGSGVYSKPPNSTAQPDTEIRSAMFNGVIDDLVADANNPRPMSAGGTGAQNPAGARAAFEVDKKVVFSVKGANYTLVKDDNNGTIAVSANATMALSTVATLGASWHAIIIADGGIATIDPSGSEKINGADTLVLQNGQSALVVATGISGDEFTAIVFSGDVYSKAEMDAKIAGACPVGSVIMMAGNGTTPPAGFLLMNGAPCTSTYPQLRAFLLANGANVNGNGDPIIEDMGGYFPRGWRSGQVVDSGRVFGSTQADDLKSHSHVPVGKVTGGAISNNSSAVRFYSDTVFTADFGSIPATGATGGAETRPVNKTFTYWIKAYGAEQVPGSADFAALANNVQGLQTSVDAKGIKAQPAITPSGGAFTLAGIPAGAKRFMLKFSGLVMTGDALIICNMGTASGLVSSGYLSRIIGTNASAIVTTVTGGTAIAITDAVANGIPLWGEFEFRRLAPGSNKWNISGSIFRQSAGVCIVKSGVDLGGELTQIQISNISGTATFGGANSVACEWEF